MHHMRIYCVLMSIYKQPSNVQIACCRICKPERNPCVLWESMCMYLCVCFNICSKWRIFWRLWILPWYLHFVLFNIWICYSMFSICGITIKYATRQYPFENTFWHWLLRCWNTIFFMAKCIVNVRKISWFLPS